MEDDNNLNQLLIGNDAPFIQNLNDYEENNRPLFLCLAIIFFLIIYFYYIQIYTLYSSINYFIYEINTASDIIFEKCKKYPSLKDIYSSIFNILFITSLLISAVIINIQNNEIAEKLFSIFINFFFYLVGPLLTGFSIMGLIFYDKVCFICSGNDPTNMSFDYSSFLSLFIFFF